MNTEQYAQKMKTIREHLYLYLLKLLIEAFHDQHTLFIQFREHIHVSNSLKRTVNVSFCHISSDDTRTILFCHLVASGHRVLKLKGMFL